MWAEEPETPEEWMMRKEAAEVSVRYLSAVPARTLDMISRHAQGWTLREIAAHHGLSGTRVQSLVYGAVRGLERMHESHGSWWHTDRGDVPCEQPTPDAPLDPVPNALCTRCTDPFKSSNVGTVRWCEPCRSGRCPVCRRSTCQCVITATCQDCGKSRTVKTVAGKRCRACYMAWLNGSRLGAKRDACGCGKPKIATRKVCRACSVAHARKSRVFERGERHHAAVLTEDTVRAIRRMKSGGSRVSEIANALGLNYWTTRGVARGETWSHVT